MYSPLKTTILKTMGNTYVNPFNDFFIRFLLGSEGNEDLCLSFINTVLDDADFPPVSKVTIKNPFNLKEALNAKESVTDVKVETGEGHVFDVEVQTGKLAAFEKRTLFYWSKMYTAQMGLCQDEGFGSQTRRKTRLKAQCMLIHEHFKRLFQRRMRAKDEFWHSPRVMNYYIP